MHAFSEHGSSLLALAVVVAEYRYLRLSVATRAAVAEIPGTWYTASSAQM